MPEFDSESVRTERHALLIVGPLRRLLVLVTVQDPDGSVVACFVWTLAKRYGIRQVTTPPHTPLIARRCNLWMCFPFGRVWPGLLALMTEDSLVKSEHVVESKTHVFGDYVYFSVCLVRTRLCSQSVCGQITAEWQFLQIISCLRCNENKRMKRVNNNKKNSKKWPQGNNNILGNLRHLFLA